MIAGRTTLASALLSATILCSPAHATPPDVIDIREQPFGLSETHLFVLRSSSDNLGLYESMRSETFLVAINAETGEEEHWLIDRTIRSSQYSDDGEMLGYTVTRDEGVESINPFTILTERNAAPWSAVSQTGRLDIQAKFARAGGNAWQASYPSGQVFEVTDAALAEQLDQTRVFMASNVADHPRMSTLTTRGLFADRTIPLETCEPGMVFNHYALSKPGEELLVRMDCSDRDELGVTSIIVRFKEVAAQETIAE